MQQPSPTPRSSEEGVGRGHDHTPGLSGCCSYGKQVTSPSESGVQRVPSYGPPTAPLPQSPGASAACDTHSEPQRQHALFRRVLNSPHNLVRRYSDQDTTWLATGRARILLQNSVLSPLHHKEDS